MSHESVARSGKRRTASRHATHPVAQPFAEIAPLESRTLLSASVAADGTLVVTGTDGPDQVILRLGVEPNHVTVQEGSTTLFVFLRDRVTAIAVDLGAGDDTFNLDLTPGLVTGRATDGSPVDLPIRVTGGTGTDAVLVLGSPPAAAGAVHSVLTVGPDVGAGKLVSRAVLGDVAGPSQSLAYTGMESISDTSIAASLTVVGSAGANVVELTAGPLAGGVVPTGALHFFDVTPAPTVTTAQPPANAAVISTTAAAPATAAADAGDPAARREAKRLAKQAKAEAKRAAKAAKLEAKRLAKEQKRAAALARKNKLAPAAPAPALPAPAPAPATPAAPELFTIDRAHAVIHFANKANVTIDAGAGDDRIDVKLAGAVPAGLTTLTIEGGAGADRVADSSLPAGVAIDRPNCEASVAARDFDFTTGRGPASETPIPTDPPPPPPTTGNNSGATATGATSSNDRDATSTNASSSATASSSGDEDDDSSSSKDDSNGSKDDDDKISKDSNASNED